MSSEYVRLAATEKFYGYKNLLQTQLDTLTIAKRIHTFKNLRRDELVLKIALLTKLDEIKNEILILDKLLPKTQYKQPKDDNNEEPLLSEMTKEMKAKMSLEDELNEIRRKLDKLQG